MFVTLINFYKGIYLKLVIILISFDFEYIPFFLKKTKNKNQNCEVKKFILDD